MVLFSGDGAGVADDEGEEEFVVDCWVRRPLCVRKVRTKFVHM